MLQRSQHPAYQEWAARLVGDLPRRWQKRLVSRWQKTRDAFDGATLGAEGEATRQAARWLQDMLDGLRTVNIPLDASDDDICARAEVMADHCAKLAEVFHDRKSLRAAMEHAVRKNHLEPWQGEADRIEAKGNACATRECRDQTDSAAIARMVDAYWWRRQLRKLHAKAVEGAAISIGYVNKTRDVYVSNESVVRRLQQNRRNAATLEATIARNENGQEYTLAELAAKSTSNKAIKRGELMTRIAGFERIARDCEHVGLFFTMTCPSRMHKWKTVEGGKVVENKRYDGTLPRDAQKYLSKVWARIRAKLDREGFRWYGFRIAEPNHDGTPHWHLLVFFASVWPGCERAAAMPRVCALVRRYALMDSPNEKGAKKHRVDFEPIDWSKGSAAGYIAKYVSKNIDGYRVEKDLYGNDAITTSVRVESWAATWGIRQFQQVGGAPVTVWREMRRVKTLPDGAPEHLVTAHRAVNKVAQIEGENASVAWDRYTRAQGGVFCGRSYRIKLAVEESAGTGRYGEPLGARPVGVETVVVESYRDGIVTGKRNVNWLVRSVRYVWEIIRKRSRDAHAGVARAWTRVNNCTRSNFNQLRKDFDSVPLLMGPMPFSEKWGASGSFFEFCGPLDIPKLNKDVEG
ncbi:MAG TPA: replication endonuclease [Burkholderiaceae bacterium]|nr:replication endonuclease [Burkholderiaceae bacterium]